tara:strand:- start:2633 stop:3598 length:966 start_codon:yes stop_codon:yes gene_type:complete
VGNPKEFPTMLSFCSGYGGIEKGLELTGNSHRVLAYVEIEAFAIANLVAKMEQGKLAPAPIWTDIKTFPAHLFRECIDLIVGGYPCQPFSNAGKRAGKDDPRDLWKYIREHVRTIKPSQCFFENVEGHISLGLSTVISDLEEDGYDSTWGIFSAAECGAPHQRKRVYILAALQHTNPNSGDGSAQQERQHQRAEELSRSGAGPVGSLVANSDNAGQQPSEGQLGSPEARHGEAVADTLSERSQGRLQGRQDTQWQSEYGYAGRSSSAHRQQGSDIWDVEPDVGRVAHGIADRVDRLRLLGNGVVPNQAAKAWQILNERRFT